MDKVLFLPREAIRPDLAPGRSSCISSDMITVEGNRVGFMYREAPDNELDNSCRFFGCTESQDFVDDPKRLGLYRERILTQPTMPGLARKTHFSGSDTGLPLSAERRAPSTISIASTLNSGLTIPSIG